MWRTLERAASPRLATPCDSMRSLRTPRRGPRNALLFAALFKNESPPDLFQKFAMFLQADLNGYLAALLISNKVNSVYGSIVVQTRRAVHQITGAHG